ncbi:SanA/YdcF family protein [Salegentibacter sediminis]|uniref:SanA/YdcF family protein n=1 Tax=Salegentibacter sediminis TaxID=1930251 RepID=UPI0009C11CF8|nr:ElyC/SanA/YdcF family protein [Salegentibacter sediminis]
MKQIKKVILATVLSLIIAILIALGLKAYIERDTQHLIFEDISLVPPSETVIVLGASVHSDGKLSPILKDRVDTALELYRNKKVKRFLVTGDHTTDDYNEVNAMGNYLMKRGIPESKILLDHAGLDTYDSMYRSNAVLGVEDAIVVTQKFHLPRTIFIAKGLKLPYTGFAARSHSYKTTNKIERRELLANFKALYEVLLKKEPTTLEDRL